MSNYPSGAEHHPSAPYNEEGNFNSLEENEMAIEELKHLIKRLEKKTDEVSVDFVKALSNLLHIKL